MGPESDIERPGVYELSFRLPLFESWTLSSGVLYEVQRDRVAVRAKHSATSDVT